LVLGPAIAVCSWYVSKLATERQAEQQAIAKAILNSDNYPAVVLDDQGQVIEWNDGMAELTGVDCVRAKREGLSAVMCNADDAAKHENGFTKSFSDPDLVDKLTVINCRLRTADGKETPVRVSVRIVEFDSRKKLAFARVDKQTDISEIGTSPDTQKKIETEVSRRINEDDLD